MDSMTIIAVASIVIAGITTGFGTMGPALAEGRAVATALTSLAQQPDASATITRTLFVGLAMIESTAIYCFVVSMILIFANPFWNHVDRPDRGEVDHAHRLVHRRRAGAQLPHPGVVDEALPLQAGPARHRRAGEADRRRARGRRAKQAEAEQERDEFQRKNEEFDAAARRAAEPGDGRGEAERQRLLDEARKAADALTARRQEALRAEADGLSLAVSRRDPAGSVRHRAQGAGGPGDDGCEERHGEVFTLRLREHRRRARARSRSALDTAAEPALVRSAFELPAAQRDAIQNALNETFSAAVPLRFETRTGAGLRHRAERQRPEAGLEHRGLPRVAGERRRRASERTTPTPRKQRRARRPHFASDRSSDRRPGGLRERHSTARSTGIPRRGAARHFAPRLAPREVGTVGQCLHGHRHASPACPASASRS